MYAPVSGVHALLSTRDTLKRSVSGTPLEITPVIGSARMSDRASFSSTKYGPSVSAAVNTQARTRASLGRVGHETGSSGNYIGTAAEQALADDDTGCTLGSQTKHVAPAHASEDGGGERRWVDRHKKNLEDRHGIGMIGGFTVFSGETPLAVQPRVIRNARAVQNNCPSCSPVATLSTAVRPVYFFAVQLPPSALYSCTAAVSSPSCAWLNANSALNKLRCASRRSR